MLRFGLQTAVWPEVVERCFLAQALLSLETVVPYILDLALRLLGGVVRYFSRWAAVHLEKKDQFKFLRAAALLIRVGH